MTKFIESFSGFINADQIKRVRKQKNNHGVWREIALLKDGDSVEIYGDAGTALADYLPNHNPNLEVWVVYTGSDAEPYGPDNLLIDIYPIVAWRTVWDGTVEPVTYESFASDTLATLIHDTAKGTWIAVDDCRFTSAEKMMNWLYTEAEAFRSAKYRPSLVKTDT